MKIEQIGLYTSPRKIAVKKNSDNYSHNYSSSYYSPVFYKDYNITFGERLFRTPANFYAQDFNKKNMPKAMKEYLNEDYEDRQNIAPAQMMKIVYDDINLAESLEEVKEMYGDHEPLFADLHSVEGKRFREGTLAEIEIMCEPGKTLFKNGKDDLGLYLLKKVYIEGKSFNEIKKDFKKDISVHYNGVSDLTYQTFRSFGIHFPNKPFWNSFIATREDFPRNYKPRKAAQSHAGKLKRELTIADINKGNIPQKPAFNPQEHEIKKITDAFMKGSGSKDDTTRELRKSLKPNDPKLQFIQKYFGQISSITLERVHASDEMREYFETADKSDTNRIRMKKYWNQSPEMKAYLSLVMSDTIKLFFLTYGADGNNDEFRELLEYADSIKPNREEQKRLHNQKQLEYEQMFEELDKQEVKKETKAQEVLPSEINPEKEIEEVLRKNPNVKTYHVNGKDKEDYVFVADLNESFEEYLKKDLIYFPSHFASKYLNVITNDENVSDRYKLSFCLHHEGLLDKVDDPQVMSQEEFEDEHNTMRILTYRKLFDETLSAQLAMAETLRSSGLNLAPNTYKYLPYEYLSNFDESETDQIKSALIKNKNKLNDNYKKLMRGYTQSELQKTTLAFVDQISTYNPDNTLIADNDLKESILMLKEGMIAFKPNRKYTGKFIKEVLQLFPYAKSILSNPSNKEDTKAKFDVIMMALIRLIIDDQPRIIMSCTTNDIYRAHKNNLSLDTHSKFRRALDSLSLDERSVFYADKDTLKRYEKKFK